MKALDLSFHLICVSYLRHPARLRNLEKTKINFKILKFREIAHGKNYFFLACRISNESLNQGLSDDATFVVVIVKMKEQIDKM